MKDFTLHPEALELKQLGFDELCFTVYEKNHFTLWSGTYQNHMDWKDIISAPTYSQAFRWFREKHDLHALIMPKTTPSNTTVYYIYKGKFEKNWDNCFEAYEEAELELLKCLIILIKEKQNGRSS